MVAGGDRYFPLTQGTHPTNLADTNAPIVFDTDGAEQKALADYLVAASTWSDPDIAAAQDDRIQRLSIRRDGVLDPDLVGVAHVGNALHLTFSTLPGKGYVPAAASAVAGPWVPLAGSFWLEGDGYEQTIGVASDGPSRFFRIELEP